MKKVFINIVLMCLCSLMMAGCAPVVAGAAVGVAGTVAVYDRQSINGSMNDIDMANVMLKSLQNEPSIRNQCHIELTVYHGTVLLVGQAPTQELKDSAEEIAKTVPGIKRFYNEITISGPTSPLTRTNDTWLTAKVKSKLLATKGLKSGQVKVLTENSTVFLMGIVSREQADLAVAVTQQISGVIKVVKVFQYTSK